MKHSYFLKQLPICLVVGAVLATAPILAIEEREGSRIIKTPSAFHRSLQTTQAPDYNEREIELNPENTPTTRRPASKSEQEQFDKPSSSSSGLSGE